MASGEVADDEGAQAPKDLARHGESDDAAADDSVEGWVLAQGVLATLSSVAIPTTLLSLLVMTRPT